MMIAVWEEWVFLVWELVVFSILGGLVMVVLAAPHGVFHREGE